MAVVLGAGGAGCRKAEGPGAMAAGQLLSEAANKVRYSESCQGVVPMGHARSYPLPVKEEGQLTYGVFFYALQKKGIGEGQKPVVEVGVPAVAARFMTEIPGGGCREFKTALKGGASSSLGPRFTPEAERMGMSRYDREQAELYAAIEKASAVYFKNGTDDEARKSAEDFFVRFTVMSEPGLRPYYHQLSPEFWDWAGQLTGKKL
jgi:hypothetical protein